jgi:hypothetical protein
MAALQGDFFLQWPEGRRQAIEGPGYGGEGMPYRVEGMLSRGERGAITMERHAIG